MAFITGCQPLVVRIEAQAPDSSVMMKGAIVRRVNLVPTVFAVPDVYNLVFASSGEPSLVCTKGNAVNVFPRGLWIQHMSQVIGSIPNAYLAVVSIATRGKILSCGIERNCTDSDTERLPPACGLIWYI